MLKKITTSALILHLCLISGVTKASTSESVPEFDLSAILSIFQTPTIEVKKINKVNKTTKTGTDFSASRNIIVKEATNTTASTPFLSGFFETMFKSSSSKQTEVVFTNDSVKTKHTKSSIDSNAKLPRVFDIFDDDNNLEFRVSLNSNGDYHGKWTKYRPNGSIIYTTNYLNGIQDGYRLAFDEDGNLISTYTYERGEIITMKNLTRSPQLNARFKNIKKISKINYIRDVAPINYDTDFSDEVQAHITSVTF